MEETPNEKAVTLHNMSHNSDWFLGCTAVCHWWHRFSANTGQRDCDVYGVNYNRYIGAYLR